MQQRLKY